MVAVSCFRGDVRAKRRQGSKKGVRVCDSANGVDLRTGEHFQGGLFSIGDAPQCGRPMPRHPDREVRRQLFELSQECVEIRCLIASGKDDLRGARHSRERLAQDAAREYVA